MAICAELAVELGVDPRTVSRYWEKAQRWTRRTLKPQDVETWRMHQLQLLDQSARAAREEGRYGEVAQLLKVAASITGTNVAVKVEHSGGISMTHATSYANVSLEVLEADVAKLQDLQRQITEVEPGVVLLEPSRLRDDNAATDRADGHRWDAVPMARAQPAEKPAETPVNARQAAVERAMGRLRGG
jgi:hypothetical protein